MKETQLESYRVARDFGTLDQLIAAIEVEKLVGISVYCGLEERARHLHDPRSHSWSRESQEQIALHMTARAGMV